MNESKLADYFTYNERKRGMEEKNTEIVWIAGQEWGFTFLEKLISFFNRKDTLYNKNRI
jgi:hypothetical protein